MIRGWLFDHVTCVSTTYPEKSRTRTRAVRPARTCTCNTHRGPRTEKRRTTGIGTWLPLAQTGGVEAAAQSQREPDANRILAPLPLPLPLPGSLCFTRISWPWARARRLETWQGNRSAGPNRSRQISLPADDDERTKTRLHAPISLSHRLERSFGLVGQQQQDRFRFDLPAGGCVYLLLVVVICCDRVLVFYGGAMKSTPHC